jgi:hypothetical protein
VAALANSQLALKTTVTPPGTAVNAENMQNIEDGIDALDDIVNVDGVTLLQESGEDTLTLGAIDDGDFFVRDGTDVVGVSVAEAQVKMFPNQLINGVWHKQLWVAGWKPTLTNGCGYAAQIEMSTNKNVYDYLPFDKDAIEYGYVNLVMPDDYTGGVIYFKPYWLHPATTTNFKVSWGLQGVSLTTMIRWMLLKARRFTSMTLEVRQVICIKATSQQQ